jgi:tetratricopeptide (TPR) repeat protein
VSAVVRGYGEVRQTVEIGPSVADRKGRVRVTLHVKESGALPESAKHRAKVSARQLAIPDRAWREYNDAQKKLERHDVDGAIARLEKAVEFAPQFATAWNNLGTIAYQTKRFEKAEGHFREALVQDPEAYEPLVNLGGVLLTLGRPDEALPFNLHSALRRPEDALANSQLGMNYFFLGKPDLGIKYLNIAKKLDAAHFSHPQLTLAEIYLRKNDKQAAAGELEEFLRVHPDWPAAASLRGAIEKLRKERR